MTVCPRPPITAPTGECTVDADLKGDFSAIKRELRIILWMLAVTNVGVALLVAKAFFK